MHAPAKRDYNQVRQPYHHTPEIVMSRIFFLILCFSLQSVAIAETAPLWGRAKLTDTQYKPQKVVFDVTGATIGNVTSVVDRASYLSKITGADPFESSIVLVVHGSAVPFFAIKNTAKYHDLMARVDSLVASGFIKVKMCKIAAASYGLKPRDVHGFVEMVPMGDAEIVRLQNEEGHAYMR
jgi:uncharacterized protein